MVGSIRPNFFDASRSRYKRCLRYSPLLRYGLRINFSYLSAFTLYGVVFDLSGPFLLFPWSVLFFSKFSS